MSVWSRADDKCASQELPFSIDFDSTLFLLLSLFLYHWPRVEWIFTILVGVFLLTLSFCAELRFSVFYKNQSGVPYFVRLFSFSLFLNRSSRMDIIIMYCSNRARELSISIFLCVNPSRTDIFLYYLLFMFSSCAASQTRLFCSQSLKKEEEPLLNSDLFKIYSVNLMSRETQKNTRQKLLNSMIIASARN